MARTLESRGLALRSTLAGIAFACCMAASAEEPKAPTSNDQEKTMTTSTSGTVCTTVCGLPENDEDLKKLLTPEQYKVMKENGTERPFANEYWDNHEAGIYVDRISGIPLFSSKDKFDSGTGWPSFTKPLTKSVVKEITDSSHGMSRTEVRAAKSDSHLGHVFDDGPAPTRLRYCMNSASLKFVPAQELANSGLSAYAADFGIKTTAGTGDSEARDVAPAKLEKATFAAGCFWGVEDILRGTDGVKGTMVGYTGGQKANPTYKEVCTGTTGHAEAVEVEYDPAKVSYDQLLDIFWKNHNPTMLNRQGPDVGTQYRSAIFYHTPEQKTEAEASLKKLQEKYGNKKVVTEIVPATTFNKAEEYHQQYLIKNGLSNCHL